MEPLNSPTPPTGDYRLYHRFGLGISSHNPPGGEPFHTLARAELSATGNSAEMPGTLDILGEIENMRERRLAAGDQGSNPIPAYLQEIYNAEVAYRTSRALEAPVGFAERLVRFWSDHFSVSIRNPRLRATVGAFEREAIRPNLTGTFKEMLFASTLHPAMLTYLDNAQSIGPNSTAGLKTGKGLNENLAREVLELHTLGAGKGYAQKDVTAFARVLTGWTVANGKQKPRANLPPPPVGSTVFLQNWHEPGWKNVIGIRVAGVRGEDELAIVLSALAESPITADHIAFKLTRHFGLDAADPLLAPALSEMFLASGGALLPLYERLLAAADKVEAPGPIRNPDIFIAAALRALPEAVAHHEGSVLPVLNRLGQAPWTAPSPAGWPKQDNDWAAPGAMQTRMLFANRFARHAVKASPYGKDDVMAFLDHVLPGASKETRRTVSRAINPQQGLVLALLSPEFQRT